MSPTSDVVSEETLLQIVEAIQSIRFGYVQVVVRDYQVVQIETTQKVRVHHDAYLTSGGRTTHPSFADQTTGSKRPFVEHNGHASGELVPGH